MSTVTKPQFTPEDLLAMPDGDRYELVDGQLVERTMGALSTYIAGELFLLLGAFCKGHCLGWVFPGECSYQCFPDAPKKVRKPDVSFIRRGRLPGERIPEGHVPIPPDLAAEVISPNDLAYETDKKVEEYLGAGVRLVWVVNPKRTQSLLIGPTARSDGYVSTMNLMAKMWCRVSIAG